MVQAEEETTEYFAKLSSVERVVKDRGSDCVMEGNSERPQGRSAAEGTRSAAVRAAALLWRLASPFCNATAA